MHSLRWDPSSVNEFASVGENATVLFWMLDETGDGASLNVHEAAVPEDLLQPHSMVSLKRNSFQVFRLILLL